MTRFNVLLLSLIMLLGGGGAGFAVAAGRADEVRLCVTKTDGSVRVVAKGGCKTSERLEVVNQEGPRGPVGPAGARGPMGYVGPQGPPGDPQAVPPVLPVYASGRILLDVGGGTYQAVKEVAGCNQPRFGEPPLPCRVTLVGGLRAETLNWIGEGLADVSNERNVELVEVDNNYNITRRLGINAARFTRIALLDLDSAKQEPTGLVLDVAGELVPGGPGGTVTPVSGQPTLRSERFRVSVNNEPHPMITQVADLVIEEPGVTNDVTLSVTSAVANGGEAMLRGWSQEAATGGVRTVKVELLDSTLDTVLLTISMSGAAPLGYPEPFQVRSSADQTGRLSVDVVGHYAQIS